MNLGVSQMEGVYHKSHSSYSYEILDEEAYEQFWWGKRPSSREALETWLTDPHKTQYQMLKEHGKKNIGWHMQGLIKAGIIRRFQREDDDKLIERRHKKRRTDMDIYAEILYLANEGGVKKTVMVYQANLNFTIIKGYLSGLVEQGLLEFDGKIYKTTDKGIEFLNHYEEIDKLGTRGPF